ncbi:hypothetical protein B0H63DRAFT_525225 [Podospora didyma]|uniref:Uncharacterized protein n=1 Tax=Podospora didyma TaxID=330526 RepID=A0AAE0NBI6_9PEZI|nr:hypothetical protein B0H63DRAFT_525225 [Podospora didyma]
MAPVSRKRKKSHHRNGHSRPSRLKTSNKAEDTSSYGQMTSIDKEIDRRIAIAVSRQGSRLKKRMAEIPQKQSTHQLKDGLPTDLDGFETSCPSRSAGDQKPLAEAALGGERFFLASTSRNRSRKRPNQMTGTTTCKDLHAATRPPHIMLGIRGIAGLTIPKSVGEIAVNTKLGFICAAGGSQAQRVISIIEFTLRQWDELSFSDFSGISDEKLPGYDVWLAVRQGYRRMLHNLGIMNSGKVVRWDATPHLYLKTPTVVAGLVGSNSKQESS